MLEFNEITFFVHDSLLFSNIEVDRKNKIIEMYGRETKQVFISIDTIDLLSKGARQVISDNTVLKNVVVKNYLEDLGMNNN
ncbi:DUF2326 domain-containing protein [Lacticaseibacillus paracasei subsp. paracasei]|uniref:DUF2326 domain-containing protein n=1 Tax=Lacticaseibacillus paracasei TaxID=1597 RepID=UPI000AC279AD|nr:DUF2326 domain-containing protein [Lacticaseibacillus paracasei]MCD0433303.1 DUF2326 domain-containing protein [Lacticaseibacillus paracasei subsp. paracasei]